MITGPIKIGAVRCRPRRGHAVVEATLLAPWILFLFAAIFDFGMYSRALITVENAARSAALYTSISTDSADDTDLACTVVLAQMKTVSNTKTLTNCNTAPLVVSAVAGLDTEGFTTSLVTVAYQTPKLIPLPFMPGQATLTRTALMRVKP